jgi:dCMP deaminase
MTDKWDRRFLGLAFYIAQWSKDPGTKVGAVLVDPETRTILGTGYNGLPRGVEDHAARLHDRNLKLMMTAHAEVNAIYSAARFGTKLDGKTIYSTFQPCSVCTAAIIQAGLRRVVCPDTSIPEPWSTSMTVAREMMSEAGVVLEPIGMDELMQKVAYQFHATALVR